MKKLLLSALALGLTMFTNAQSNFITAWTHTATISQLQFLAESTGAINYTWTASPSGNSGTGFIPQPLPSSLTTLTLNAPANNTITLVIATNTLNQFRITSSSPDASKLIDISNWGSAVWTSFNGAFWDCINLKITATDIPNLSNVTDMQSMFYNCSSLNQINNINNWDVSNVQNMNFLFSGCTLFNQPLSNWNTSNVTSMFGMFFYADAFNQDISSWNTGNVTDMTNMFGAATNFNQPLNSWNTSNVTSMNSMFAGAVRFNQPLNNWNTANVTNMGYMFFHGGVTTFPGFQQNIGSWVLNPNVDLQSMLNFSGMDCDSYSATLNGWNSNTLTPVARNLGAAGITYGTNAAGAHANLTGAKSWTITSDIAGSGACGLTTGVNYLNLGSNSFNFYPNPANDILNIELPTLNDNINLVITDILGKTVYSNRITNNVLSIDISSLNSGVYFITVGNSTKKIIKE